MAKCQGTKANLHKQNLLGMKYISPEFCCTNQNQSRIFIVEHKPKQLGPLQHKIAFFPLAV